MNTEDAWSLTLETPSANRYLHVIRLTAAGAAAEAGLTAEEIDDVKIAVDELCSLAMERTTEADNLRLTFRAEDGGLVIEAVGPQRGELLEVDDLAKAILDATIDELELADESLGVGFRLTKHRNGG